MNCSMPIRWTGAPVQLETETLWGRLVAHQKPAKLMKQGGTTSTF